MQGGANGRQPLGSDTNRTSAAAASVAHPDVSRHPPMALVRPLPRGPWWAFALGLFAFLAGVVAAGLLSSPWPLVASVVGIVVFVEARGLRCPQCGRRLTERRVPVDDGPAYRMFWECRHCSALWDGDMIFDPTRD